MFPGIFDDLLGVQLFGYISFRMAMAALTAFALALITGGPVIRWLTSHKLRETAKGDLALLDELSKRTGKANTPTMGGSFLVGSLLVAVILWGRLDNISVVLAVLLTAILGAVGFVDDFGKLSSTKKGISPRAKMLGQTAAALFADQRSLRVAGHLPAYPQGRAHWSRGFGPRGHRLVRRLPVVLGGGNIERLQHHRWS